MAKGLHMALVHGHRFDMPPAFVSRWVSIEGEANMAPQPNVGMLKFDVEHFGHATVSIESQVSYLVELLRLQIGTST